MTTPRFTFKHFAPQHWPTWFSLGFLRFSAHLPYRCQLSIGRMVGRIFYLFAKKRKHIAAVNLRLCFPHLSPAEHKELLYQNFLSAGMGLIEFGIAWWTPPHRLFRLVQFDGLEHLKAAIDADQGVILLGAHFTTLDLAGQLLALRVPLGILYRDSKNPVFDVMMARRRQKIFKASVHRKNLREFIKTIQAGLPTWYAPDQDYGRKHSVFAPFFGVPAATITATSRLATLTGAKLVPFFHYRLPNAKGYILRFLPPLENYPTGDDYQDACYINRVIEAGILPHPEQYLWQHRRFKTRPMGEQRPYKE